MAWNCTWELLATNGWSDSQLKQLQEGWEKMDFSADMSAALEVERAMTMNYFDQLAESSAKLWSEMKKREQSAGLPANKLPTLGFLRRCVHVPLWRAAWLRQDELRALNRWQSVIETDRMARRQSWNSVGEQIVILERLPKIISG
jgi:hypothetical protein